MPTYEYVCTDCGRRMDVSQSFTDKPLTDCERCGGRLKRVFHPVGVLFKGSGFYSTDNKSKRTGTRPDGAAKTDGNKPDVTKKTETSPPAGAEKTA